MKRLLMKSALLTLGCAAALNARAGIEYTYAGPSYSIPDGSLAGAYSSITVGGSLARLTDITVTLDISGGYNGDLYGYLSYNGALVPLMNRVGVNGSNPFGSADSGFAVTLVSSGYGNIHGASAGDNGTPLTGTYLADGQNISPLSAPSSFNSGGGSITLDGTFGGMNPNGTWTLFFADVSAGGGTSQVTGWSLDITAVPEPVNVALGVFGGLVVLTVLLRSRPMRERLHRWNVAVNHWIDAV